MSNLFALYHRKEVRRDERNKYAQTRNADKPVIAEKRESESLCEAQNTDAQELKRLKKMRDSARGMGGSSAHIDGLIKALEARVKKKTKKLKEDDMPMPAGGGGAPGGSSKAFVQISIEAANFLVQKESELSGLPADSPELAMVRNAEGLLKDYTPTPEDNDRMVVSKVALLAKEIRNLEGGSASGEVAAYLRAFAEKIDEFRATIDVSDNGRDVLGLDDEKPEPAPEKPAAASKKDTEVPPSPQEKQQDLAKGLELNVK